ncbi:MULTISPECIES: hypothetical protein [Pseudofrankia]|uniref:hypothetical protein n=1 Tax=Pseudofrankia TaxID=2994363 RepID=UPI000234C174|nr:MULTISPECIES: hypothetical protein [Pseudofrankia]OHV42032.1 hypothetical protein BCD49_00265 [Pseudofrankia sp. EUN1h]
MPTTVAAPAPAPGCDPSYPDQCLQDGVGDYDCAGGSGDGPNYVRGPGRVLEPDPFELDFDGDGVGCQS